ncbi:LysE family translocator [Acinetobacter sp. ANC 4173]|uniref:LysE family translocator n=1 Tax=Acinetobacter sp. ANC 4173 TaxID=2529837 RepID=UPI00103FE358|nr:LysE family translocator [Acinetobacter sp. ANC 4173]TCB80632.1 LysE family translocator [Acinetobacter sp. ANC 4173]
MELFFFIAVTHFIALLSPGPDFFLILIHSMKYGSKLARYSVLGIAVGNALILLLIFVLLWGLGQIHPILLQLFSCLGGAYLLYLALQCFRYRDKENEHLADQDQIRIKTSSVLCFAQGLQSSVLNPKNLMFYSSLILLVYNQFNFKQLFLICLWMVCVVLFWNLFLLKLFNFSGWNLFLKRNTRVLYRLTGCCFLGFAMVLIML